MRQDERWLWAVTLLALALRLPQALCRWDEITLAYAAYWEPSADALGQLDLSTALSSWTGLHPPLYGLVLGSLEQLVPIPLVFILTSVFFSCLAVYWVGRVAGPLGALVLASSPIQMSYAAELNNYPLGVAVVAGCVLASRANWRWMGLAAVAAAWTHVLAGMAALGMVLHRVVRDRGRRDSVKLMACCVLGMLPVGAGALRLMREEGTYGQSADTTGWIDLAFSALGVEGAMISLVAVLAWRSPVVWPWLGMFSVLAMTLFLGISSTEQLQYLPLFGPPIAALVGLGVSEVRSPRLHRWVMGVLILLCSVRAGRTLNVDIHRLQTVIADQDSTRAIDLAISKSQEGDTVWMVAPANELDDDKTATAPALWRVSPWVPMALAYPVDFEYRDYRYGQPRHWQGRVVHTSTDLYAAPFDSVAMSTLRSSGEVWVVLYEHGHASGLVEHIEFVLRPYQYELIEIPRGEHPERLYRITGLTLETGTQ